MAKLEKKRRDKMNDYRDFIIGLLLTTIVIWSVYFFDVAEKSYVCNDAADNLFYVEYGTEDDKYVVNTVTGAIYFKVGCKETK